MTHRLTDLHKLTHACPPRSNKLVNMCVRIGGSKLPVLSRASWPVSAPAAQGRRRADGGDRRNRPGLVYYDEGHAPWRTLET